MRKLASFLAWLAKKLTIKLMSDNPKNKLQEYCQKNGKCLPIYETFQEGLNWISVVRLGEFETFSEAKAKKVDAEKEAASKMLKLTIKDKKTHHNPCVVRKMVLIDGENIHKLPEIDETVAYYVFLNRNHALAKKDYGIEKVLVESGRPDGVDSYIQVFVGMSLMKNKHLEEIVIYTRDKFGYALADAIIDISKNRVKAFVDSL